MSDAESTTDPRTDPAWTSWDEAEELGVEVEVGHINDAWFWVEVAWGDDERFNVLNQAVCAETREEFEALLKVSVWRIEKDAAMERDVGERLEELLWYFVEAPYSLEQVGHPEVKLWSEHDDGVGYSRVYKFGGRWFHEFGVPEAPESEFSWAEPNVTDFDIPYFCNWGLDNDTGPAPRTGTYETIGWLEAVSDYEPLPGNAAEPLQIVRRTAKKANGQLLVVDTPIFLSGKQHGPHRIGSFDSIEALLNTVELPPADRIPRTAVLKIVEPYFSQLSKPGLPLREIHRQPSVVLQGERGQLCLHIEEYTP